MDYYYRETKGERRDKKRRKQRYNTMLVHSFHLKDGTLNDMSRDYVELSTSKSKKRRK
jgi:hypothetical protein